MGQSDSRILEEVEETLERLDVTTLIVRKNDSVNLWTSDYVGGLSATRECMGRDPIPHDALRGVDVVLFEGTTSPPNTSSSVWTTDSVKVVMGFSFVGKRKRKRFNLVGWTFRSRQLNHSEVGGVTNARFLAWTISRDTTTDLGSLHDVATMNNVSGYSTIVNKVNGGKRKWPVEGETDEDMVSAKRQCLLDWKTRFNSVECATVFHRGLVTRRLELSEMAVALDLPNSRVKTFKGDLRTLIKSVEVPGKLVQSVAQCVIRDLGNRKRSSEDDVEVELNKRRKLNPIVGMTRQGQGDANDEINSKTPHLNTVTAKAAKSDDAGVPYWLWDQEVLTIFPKDQSKEERRKVIKSFNHIRDAMLCQWKWKVKDDFAKWLKEANIKDPKTLALVKERGLDAGRRADLASWWNWDGGSTPFFWRWPEIYRDEVLFGGPVRFDKEPIPWFERAKDPQPDQDPATMRKKLEKVLKQGYVILVSKSELISLLNVFFVPKGDNDLRAVYDATMSGLNDALWTPWFFLPTPDAITRELLPGYWSTDNDYADQFLNFPLHPDLIKYAGIDLTKFFPELASESGGELFGAWLRNLMGLQCSPYLSVMGASRAKRMIIGNHKDRTNPFHWERVELNLPGDPDYDCTKPRVMRIRYDGCLATAINKFVDDVRSSASTRELAWHASTKTGKMLSWLGLQDAPRKRREASQEPGAWAGAMVATVNGMVCKFVSPDRWKKTKDRIKWFAYMLYIDGIEPPEGSDWSKMRAQSPKGHLNFKKGEQFCGFLRYVAMTYSSMVPYLKGIYNTLNIWRPHRDQDGFKGIYNAKDDVILGEATSGKAKAPTHVKFSRQLRSDIEALLRLSVSESPPRLSVRPSHAVVAYLSGDASGSGFGIMLFIPGQKAIRYSHGMWSDEVSPKSSNYRESANLIMKLKYYLEKGYIPFGSELFIFTDNRVAERTYYKGSGGSKQLHNLVVELREVEMTGQLHIRTVWVAGTRLIEMGIDGLSRGDISSGVLSGTGSFLDYVPLNRSAFDRLPELKTWLDTHTSNMTLSWKHVGPEDWFDGAFKDRDGAFIWSPPPAAAQVALEQMCEAKHVHPDTSHIFLVPNLMAVEWEKRLRKVSDIVIELAPGSTLWPANQHESLTLAFVCPFLVNRPFAVGRTDWVTSRGKALRDLFKTDPGTAGSCLRKFWFDSWRDSEMLQRRVACKVLPTTLE